MLRFMDGFSEMDKALNSFGRAWQSVGGGMMPLDAYEKDGVYHLRFDLPGVSPSDVDVTVEGNLLTVTAERQFESTDDVTWLLRERPAGSHRREVRLGSRLDTNQVNANYDNGVLTVTIPMREEAKSRRIEIATDSDTVEKLPVGAAAS